MLIYTLAISLYNLAIFLTQPFNKKARLLYAGRKRTSHILNNFKRDAEKKLAWFHCASLGEFEQARPVIERLKTECDTQVAISFFSPSGYENRKNYEYADVTFYLPSDSLANANSVLNLLKPDMVCFVKYEIWINFIQTIKERNIPVYLLSATFRARHIYFRWYGVHFKQTLTLFNKIFTQDKESLALLNKNGLKNAVFSNDTRYDRVVETCRNPKKLPLIELFKDEKPLLILGSSYATEESYAAKIASQFDGLKIIIAPHHIEKQRINAIAHTFKEFNPVKYSDAENAALINSNVLIIDNIGLLSSIYQYADFAFIGGGFGTKGIHNTLEAAAFGMPVFIGPNNHERFPELSKLKQGRVLFTINNSENLQEQLSKFLFDIHALNQLKDNSKKLIHDNTGATDLIMSQLEFKPN